MTFISISDRYELLKNSAERIRARKLALEDVATEAAEADEEGAEIEEIE